MDSLNIEKEIQIAEVALNKDTMKRMEKYLKELTSSGSPSLDPEVMKQFKRHCRESDDYVRYAFFLIMRYLNKKHSEIRLSAFQMADELFNRSHAFREILITHLQAFLALTTETEAERPLPPPRSAANKLKVDSLHALQLWFDKYGQGYKKLAVGYNYLKNCKHVDFNDIRAQNQAERQRLEDAEKRKQKIMADKLAKVLKDISELKPEMDNCVREAESCLQLLLPTPTDFMLPPSEDVASQETRHQEGNVSEVDKQSQKSKKSNRSSQDELADEKKDIGQSERLGVDTASCHSLQNGQKLCVSPVLDSNNRTDICSPGLLNKSDNPQNVCAINSNSQVSVCSKEGSLCELNNSATNSDSFKEDRAEDSTFKTTTSETDGLNKAESLKGESENNSEAESTIDDDDNDEAEMSGNENDLKSHGLPNPNFSFVIELPNPDSVSVQVTTNNTDIVCSLRDALKLITNYLPKVIKWLEILGKNGAQASDIKRCIDLKVRLETIKAKSLELKLVVTEQESTQEVDASDDEEFEEVPEKEGYEPHIPLHMRAEYGLDTVPAPVQAASKLSYVEKPEDKSETKSQASTSQHWSLKERIKPEDRSDPTSLASALARIRPDSSTCGQKNSSASSSTQSPEKQSSTDVPVVEFGTDLVYWENPDKLEAPSIVKLDSLHRFWAPKENETEKPSQHDIAAVKNRVFYFTGKFEPVKWKCRAVMSSGKLCERMDRVKCPFHGNIIPRDKEGRPNGQDQPSSSKDQTVTPESKNVKDELPPWLDPELQREIEQATGHDLGSARSQKLLDKKTKGKGKGKKKSKLTDTEALKNTARRRLENKIFSKGSMKRVCSTLDNADFKRVRDKFANQFNYSLG